MDVVDLLIFNCKLFLECIELNFQLFFIGTPEDSWPDVVSSTYHAALYCYKRSTAVTASARSSVV